MFTRTHYKRVKELLEELDVDDTTRSALTKLFSTFFAEDNSAFKPERFSPERLESTNEVVG